MKKIENLEEYKFTVIDRNGLPQPIVTSDGDLLKTPLNTVVLGRGGVNTIDALRQIDKICNMIDKAMGVEKTLLLEEADYGFLKKKHAEYTNWSPQDDIRKCIIKMSDKLAKAIDYDPAKK